METTLRLSCRLYSSLLALYPASLRKQFGEEMVEVFRNQMQDALAAEDGSVQPEFGVVLAERRFAPPSAVT